MSNKRTLQRELAKSEANVKLLTEAIHEATKEEYELSERACNILYKAMSKVEYDGVALGTYVGREVAMLRQQFDSLKESLESYFNELTECEKNYDMALLAVRIWTGLAYQYEKDADHARAVCTELFFKQQDKMSRLERWYIQICETAEVRFDMACNVLSKTLYGEEHAKRS